MKLLLDEMWSPAIAEQLRRRGHDAIASLERDDLRGLSDDAVLDLARSLRRVVVTRDVGDYAGLARRLRGEDRDHHGVVLVSPRRFSAAAEGIGALVRALDALLKEHRGNDDLVNDVMWLGSNTA
ncbi:MAG: DUF5615 family PIN-like protein [Chloroflexi bacterium]|nr:DUF5615 family PIN-like protein [Chloroflexota bacterium]